MAFQWRVRPSQRPQHGQRSAEPRKQRLLQPLSLQQSSVNCIVTNLEKYPPDLLALLPLHFRRELLLILPPADIFQLEQTKVVEDIDMENEIWMAVNERYDCNIALEIRIDGTRSLSRALPSGFQPAVTSSPQPISWKAHFVSCLVSLLLCMKPFQLSTNHPEADYYISYFGHRNYIILLQFLFCNRFFKLKQLTDVGGFPLQVSEVILLLSRYSRFFTSLVPRSEPLVPLSEWVRFLLEDCHIEPPDIIKIDLEHFIVESGTAFQHFLSNAKNLQFFVQWLPGPEFFRLTSEDMLRNIAQLSSILSCDQLKKMIIVQKFMLGNRVIYGMDHVHQKLINKMLQKCFLHPLFVQYGIDCKPSIVFQNLKHINITSYRNEIELSTLCSLFALTQNHDFQSISVSGPTIRCDEHQKEVVIQVLENSLTTPISSSCCLISLSDMTIPFSFMFWLMKLFLYSPSTITQKMVVSSCEIDCSVVPSEKELKSIPEPPDLADSHKSLHLSKLFLERFFLEALARLPSVVLDELKIEHNPKVYRRQYSDHMKLERWRDSVIAEMLGALLLTLPTIPVCRIKSLSFQFYLSSEWVSYQQSLPILNLCDSKRLISAPFELSQKLLETAVSLQCEISSNHIEVLLASLHDEWKMNGGSVLLDQLLIDLSDSFYKIPHFRSSLEKCLMVYPIHDIARYVDIRQKGSESSIFEMN